LRLRTKRALVHGQFLHVLLRGDVLKGVQTADLMEALGLLQTSLGDSGVANRDARTSALRRRRRGVADITISLTLVTQLDEIMSRCKRGSAA
jgi:hypothetical protein